MRLTLETEPFHRMLEMLGQGVPERRGKFEAMRLEAGGGRLRVEQGQLLAEMDVMVWEEGRCAVSAARLKRAVRASLTEPAVVLELEDECLRLGHSIVPCVTECSPVQWQRASRIYFASAFGIAPSDVVPLDAVA